MLARVDDITEKMYEFEQNKKNNLLFYGIGSDNRETPDVLIQKILTIMKTTLGLRRDIPVLKARLIRADNYFCSCIFIKGQQSFNWT